MAESDKNTPGENVEIPRELWAAFLDDFSRTHAHWLATVEVVGREGDTEIEIRDRSFSGAHLNADTTRIAIGLSDQAAANPPEHAVINPIRIKAVGTDDLVIEDAGGTKTILHFSPDAERSTKPLAA